MQEKALRVALEAETLSTDEKVEIIRELVNDEIRENVERVKAMMINVVNDCEDFDKKEARIIIMNVA